MLTKTSLPLAIRANSLKKWHTREDANLWSRHSEGNMLSDRFQEIGSQIATS